jgi:hypothetical protein
VERIFRRVIVTEIQNKANVYKRMEINHLFDNMKCKQLIEITEESNKAKGDILKG